MNRLSLSILLVSVGLGSVSSALAQRGACPAGQERSEDTDGHCCWPGQGWSTSRGVCVGTPVCPAGLVATDAGCACEPGREVNADTDGHCCWPGQVWVGSRSACVGTPSTCPAGYRAAADSCEAMTAAEAARARCDAGDGRACVDAADPTTAEGVALLTRGCDAHSALACSVLASSYRFGWGAAVDLPRATALEARAGPELIERCEGGAGDAQECVSAAVAAWYGYGVTQDRVHGAALYERACHSTTGSSYVRAIACVTLGMELRSGESLPQDVSLGFTFCFAGTQALEVGCAGGDADQCAMLGVYYQGGYTPDGLMASSCVPQDLRRARELLQRACDADPRHCGLLSGLH